MGDAIEFFRGVEFKGAYPTIDDCPSSYAIPLIAFTGRSNSGKSSLLSSICGHKNLARASRTAGKTRTLNYFIVPPSSVSGPGLYLVDMPGYGYANLSKSEAVRLRESVDEYLARAENLRLVVIVLDARRELGREEKSVLAFCEDHNRTSVLARTKWDLLNQREKGAARRSWKEQGLDEISIPVSSVSKDGVDEILEKVRSVL